MQSEKKPQTQVMQSKKAIAKQIQSSSVKQLQGELKRLGLPTNGRKVHLIDRLENDLKRKADSDKAQLATGEVSVGPLAKTTEDDDYIFEEDKANKHKQRKSEKNMEVSKLKPDLKRKAGSKLKQIEISVPAIKAMEDDDDIFESDGELSKRIKQQPPALIDMRENEPGIIIQRPLIEAREPESEKNFKQMTVKELKAELQRRGLKMVGNKADLIARLQTELKDGKVKPKQDTGAVLNGEEKEEELKQNKNYNNVDEDGPKQVNREEQGKSEDWNIPVFQPS
jgi:hypothetical protein